MEAGAGSLMTAPIPGQAFRPSPASTKWGERVVRLNQISIGDLLQLTFSFGISWYLLIYVRRSLDDLRDAITALSVSINKRRYDPPTILED